MEKCKNLTSLIGTLNFTKDILIAEHHGTKLEYHMSFSTPPYVLTELLPCLARYHALAFDFDFSCSLGCDLEEIH